MPYPPSAVFKVMSDPMMYRKLPLIADTEVLKYAPDGTVQGKGAVSQLKSIGGLIFIEKILD